jgi:hypothetical protein
MPLHVQPSILQYTRVDEIIECYEINHDTQAALLALMPDAYGGEGPGEDDWPEPDNSRDKPYLLSRIWDQLPPTAKSDIRHATAKELQRARVFIAPTAR